MILSDAQVFELIRHLQSISRVELATSHVSCVFPDNPFSYSQSETEQRASNLLVPRLYMRPTLHLLKVEQATTVAGVERLSNDDVLSPSSYTRDRSLLLRSTAVGGLMH